MPKMKSKYKRGKRTKVNGCAGLYRYETSTGEITYWYSVSVKGQPESGTLPREFRLEEAKAFVHGRRVELGAREGRPVPHKNTSFSEFSEKYIDQYLRIEAPAGADREARRVRQIADHFKGKRIDHLTSQEINEYLAALIPKGLKGEARLKRNGTTNNYRNRLNSIFNQAVQWGYRADNPVKFKRLKGNDLGDRYMTEEELIALLNQCDSQFKDMVIVAAGTGIRQGELLTLNWEDVDSNYQFLTVWPNKSKTGNGRRVPLVPEVQKTLRSLEPKERKGSVFGLDRFPKRRWQTVRKNLGWGKECTEPRLKSFRWHDLRHHCASHLVMNGLNIYEVKDILGHSSVAVTERYAHLAPNTVFDRMRRISLIGKRDWAPKVVKGKAV